MDGRVSVATGNGKLGGSAFFVLRLGARIANMYPELWPRLVELYADFENYQSWTDREIPVVILSPRP